MAVAAFTRHLWPSRFGEPKRLAWPTTLAALFVVTWVLYAFIGPGQTDTDGWFPLATAMLHGHLWIDGSRPWIELVPAGSGTYYLPFPPIPAVVLMPVVAIFGEGIADTNGVSALAGAVDILLVFAMLRALRLDRVEAMVLTLGFGFGSEVFYVAATGGVHHWTEMLTVGFILAAMNLALRGRAPWVAGLLFALAVGCRPTALLAAPAFVVLYWRAGGWLAAKAELPASDSGAAATPISPATTMPGRARSTASSLARFIREINWPGVVALGLGAGFIGIWLAWYNVARFGTPMEFGYDLIRGQDGSSVLSEAWYKNGIVSPLYLARGLYSMLLRGWEFNENFPWVEPSWAGCSVLYTTPILVYLVRCRWRDPLILAGWLGFVLPVGLDLMHGNPGYAQFGYRFILDGLPFAWLLLGLLVARNGMPRGMVLAVLVGIEVSLYGMACIASGFVTT